MSITQPLKGLIVLEFSQFLAGPSAGLRLADLGARVIKIERPKAGDACRKLALKNLFVGDDSLLFHTINRNKESYVADLKNANDLAAVKQLIAKAHIMTHNFRPGVMEKIGLDYQSVQAINNKIIYAEVSGYGKIGPWKDKPGQDLLVQAISGLAHLTGNNRNTLTPFGLSIADILCGAQLVQGILAGLLLQQQTNKSVHIEVSLLESILDFQFEFLTTWLNGGGLPKRSNLNNAHALLGAPYGVYKTADGYIALAMTDLYILTEAIGLDEVKIHLPGNIETRDAIKNIIALHLVQQNSSIWLLKLKAHKVWCMPILNWDELRKTSAYKSLEIEQEVATKNGQIIKMMRGAITFNSQINFNAKPAPLLGEHTAAIQQEFLIQST